MKQVVLRGQLPNNQSKLLLRVDAMTIRTPTFRRNRRGLTLVEMMVSVVLTLMVVFALVRVFALLGDNVTAGRATIEMSGSLRNAAQMLREDLEGLTVTTLPPRSPEQNEGYIELTDGPSTDSQHFVQPTSGDAQMVSLAPERAQDQGVELIDADNDGYVDSNAYDTSVGDVDDILAFTSRRTQHPFTGTISDGRIRRRLGSTDGVGPVLIPQLLAPTQILESPNAEIIWWLQVERNLATSDLQTLQSLSAAEQIAIATSAVGSPGITDEAARILTAQRYPNFTSATLGTPVRSLHRRVLLIRPDLDLSSVVLNDVNELAEFLSNNDISVRVIRQDSGQFRVEANSLGDLTIRRNRAYRSIDLLEDNPLRHSPSSSHISAQRSGEMLNANSLILRHGAMKDMVVPHLYADGTNERVIMLRRGKDVVLSDALAFDVQVWDPQAIVKVLNDGTAVSPNDPSYTASVVQTPYGSTGAYVDLGFAVRPKRMSPLPTGPTSYRGRFGGVPHTKSQLWNNLNATYCTWSDHYEFDGWDQDNDDVVDEGRNGIDEAPHEFGVDDPSELETSPPYPHPLRGLKVTMRIMDSGTRQVRQSSVITDFLPE